MKMFFLMKFVKKLGVILGKMVMMVMLFGQCGLRGVFMGCYLFFCMF